MFEFQTSMDRLQKFLECMEVNENSVQPFKDNSSQLGIQIKSASFSYGFRAKEKKEDNKSIDSKPDQTPGETKKEASEPEKQKKNLKDTLALKDLDLKIEEGSFVCVIGEVGAGKSSLINSIIGDLVHVDNKLKEKLSKNTEALTEEEINELETTFRSQKFEKEAPIQINETISYIQQVPWIQAKTIKENILMGNEYNEEKYNECIKICELERDLEILPAGDMTEIGDKGINLSGGQKARVSLARGVYADNPVVLMDDPLSALDASVKRKIFNNVFLGKF